MSNKNYFDQEIEDLVVKYRKDDTPKREKTRIYNNVLYPIFNKMVMLTIN